MKPQAVHRSARYLAVRHWRRRGGLARAGDAVLGGAAFALALLACLVLPGLAP